MRRFARFAIALFCRPVGRWSTEGEGITVSADEMDFKTGFVRNLQVPPRHVRKFNLPQTAKPLCFQ